MRPSEIRRSLYEPPTWMGMPRIPGILWIMFCGMLGIMAGVHAKLLIETLIVVFISVAGVVILRKVADRDPMMLKTIWLWRDYSTNYPAFVTPKDRKNG